MIGNLIEFCATRRSLVFLCTAFLVIGSLVAPIWGGGGAFGTEEDRKNYLAVVKKSCAIGKKLKDIGIRKYGIIRLDTANSPLVFPSTSDLANTAYYRVLTSAEAQQWNDIFNAVIIVLLIPLSLRGVTYRPLGAAAIFRRSMLIYGVGGVIAPFVGIKLIDLGLAAAGLA